ncbi:MAG: pantoate--beta-alanine ligase [Nitrosomonas sp.]|jgi:pantoate--beta-alanine ligase|nr:pantoate--beta-alanine ligase [Nitrosomonas sp.]
MEIITSITDLRARLQAETSIALVPTMGNLHAGHLSLVRLAQQHADCTVVSIFVNRLQFLPHEDFDRYPRTETEDCRLLQEMGTKVVFMPDEQILYPVSQQFRLTLPAMADTLEGAFRPSFFHGVMTVVLKLFNITQPQIAVFGKKDYQQLQLVRQMAEQLNLPIGIIAGDTIRAEDGLALSSRNRYLDAVERQEASRLAAVLAQIRDHIVNGERSFNTLLQQASQTLTAHGWQNDYLAICNQPTLLPATPDDRNLVILGAARLGQTRLIDNIELSLPTIK